LIDANDYKSRVVQYDGSFQYETRKFGNGRDVHARCENKK